MSEQQDIVCNDLMQVQSINMGGNRLTGQVFPPAWLLPGAVSQLRVLNLSSNAGLMGALPADLLWPALTKL